VAVGLLLAAGPAVACRVGPLAPEPAYRYFEAPDTGDPWSAKIMAWQRRERAVYSPGVRLGGSPVSGGAAAPGPRTAPGTLREEYLEFRADRRRELARRLVDWVQAEARRHYVADGPYDRWATLEETLAADGDDCDGLELLAYHLLRDFGFGDEKVYRAIVVRPADGQHHMVTLWFEEDDDPWVLDPTGAMTRGMPRLSQVPGWVPLKVFSETEEYTVRGPARIRGKSP
jgi:hypothetical protein